MASIEELVEQIKFLQQQNDIRSQEAQTLQIELNNMESSRVNEIQGYKDEINKVRKDMIDLIKRQQEEERDEGYKKSNFHDKDAKDLKPDKWTGEKDKVNFKEFYDSVLNWASVLHEDAVELLEQAGKCNYGVNEDGVGVTDQKGVATRVHNTLMAATTGEPRNTMNSVPRGEGFKAWHEMIK